MGFPFFAGSIIHDVQRMDLELENKRIEQEKIKRLALRKEAKLKGKMNATELLRKLTGADELEQGETLKAKSGEDSGRPRPKTVGSFPSPPTSKATGA